jgi:succinoglycan biosynthesis protein ExoM
MNISICICTRKRKEGLKKLLESFEMMQVPPDINVRIIIVENDTENHTQSLVNEFASRSRFKTDYFLEPQKGLVYARNRSVKEAGNCDFCCFTDDDEFVSNQWLSELVRCQREFDADAVAGPTMPEYISDVPVYIKEFNSPNTYPYGTIVNSAFTGCLLIRKKTLDAIDGPFNLILNLSGGEDTFLTKKVTKMGGVIRFNPGALAYEIVPDERTTIAYVIKRKLRTSNTELLIKSMIEDNFSKIRAVPRLCMRFLNGLLLLIPYYIFGKEQKLKGLIKIVNAVGGFSFIFGRQNKFYN